MIGSMTEQHKQDRSPQDFTEKNNHIVHWANLKRLYTINIVSHLLV